MIDKYIALLEELKKINITKDTDLEVWKVNAVNVIDRIYGEGNKHEGQINQIKYKNYPTASMMSRDGKFSSFGGGNNGHKCQEQAIGIIKSIINDLKEFELPEKKESSKNSNGININLTQNQSQKQSINVNIIIEALQDELTGNQLKEIQEILNNQNDDTQESKKSKVINKLKSFGSDVLSNIVANIITNPSIWG